MEMELQNTVEDIESIVTAKTQSLNQQIIQQMSEVESEIKAKKEEVFNYELKISKSNTEIIELANFYKRLVTMHSFLVGSPVDSSISTEDNPESSLTETSNSSSDFLFPTWYDTMRDTFGVLKTRFWETKKFMGWPTFLKELIEKTESFLSVNDVLQLISEADVEKKRKIESAINNAFSTGAKHGKFGGVNFKEIGRRYYGNREFFEDFWPKDKYCESLRDRLGLDDIVVLDVILNNTTPQTKGKLIEYTEKYVQKNLMEGIE